MPCVVLSVTFSVEKAIGLGHQSLYQTPRLTAIIGSNAALPEKVRTRGSAGVALSRLASDKEGKLQGGSFRFMWIYRTGAIKLLEQLMNM